MISLSNGWHFLLKNCNNIKEFLKKILQFSHEISKRIKKSREFKDVNRMISLSNGWHFLLKNCNNIKEFLKKILQFSHVL